MQAMVTEALLALRQHPDTGLAKESAEQTADRLVLVETRGDGSLRLVIAADGLDLNAKAAIERRLVAELPPVSIVFKRLLPSTGAVPGGPAPVAKPAPFGLQIERRAIPGVTTILAVASGKGGVGKSTVSVNLAVALAARGCRVGLLDADIYGPSVPLMLGLAGQQPQVQEGRLVPLVGHGVKAMSFGFLTSTEQPVIWRGPLLGKAFKQLCYDVHWGELEVLIIDLPPGTGDVQLTMIESLPVHAALIVTTPQDIALLDAHKALTMFERLDVPVLGLVENMAQFKCPACGHDEPVFGTGGADKMAKERRSKVLAHIPLTVAMRLGGDLGVPVAAQQAGDLAAPFTELAAAVEKDLQLRLRAL